MKKFLLATTALVGFTFSCEAFAAESLLKVTLGGSVEVVGGTYKQKLNDDSNTDYDFASFYTLDVKAAGKAGGFDCGADFRFSNTASFPKFTPKDSSITLSHGYIYMSGSFGKIQIGDQRGTTSLAVTTPSVGMGQTEGRIIDFLSSDTFSKVFVKSVDKKNGTSITYYTPKLGNENHKIQAGLTYEPKMFSGGADIISKKNAYKSVIKAAAAYDGSIDFVKLNASAHIVNGGGRAAGYGLKSPVSLHSGFTAWGLGANASAYGVKIGINYEDFGKFLAPDIANTKGQYRIGTGIAYEQDCFGVAFNYITGTAYNFAKLPPVDASTLTRLKGFDSYGIGGVYKWAPGLTSNADLVFFQQRFTDDISSSAKGSGYVFLLSQKLAF
ncbi:MAG: porin [Alphaproteobacteria bacterium]|nr:porin [Alphaproteobacteria bacterium]MCL2505261.1 porin [Alphaproteobacteria bacterium]